MVLLGAADTFELEHSIRYVRAAKSHVKKSVRDAALAPRRQTERPSQMRQGSTNTAQPACRSEQLDGKERTDTIPITYSPYEAGPPTFDIVIVIAALQNDNHWTEVLGVAPNAPRKIVKDTFYDIRRTLKELDYTSTSDLMFMVHSLAPSVSSEAD